MGRTISQDEMKVHLQEQVDFIKSSADAFDGGRDIEAKRLAVHIRTLLHDTNRSHSLFNHLGMKGAEFVDTALPFDANNQLNHGSLIFTHMASGTARFVALLDDTVGPPSTKKFDQWWNDPVFVDGARRHLSRKMLILNAANKDGGAHVDAEVEETYDDLARNNSLGHFSFDGNTWKPIPGPERVAIRQIAHELLKTIDSSYTKKVDREDGMTVGGMSFKMVSVEEGRARGYDKIKPNALDRGHVLFGRKIGRNELCPCGSGRKFKQCHGRL